MCTPGPLSSLIQPRGILPLPSIPSQLTDLLSAFQRFILVVPCHHHRCYLPFLSPAEAALERRTSAGLTSVPLIEAASEHADAETDTLAPAATAAAAVAPLPTVTDSIADVADPVVGVAHTTAASSTALPVGTTAAADAAVGTYSTVCLGGTFDHLHAGHKVLLTVAALWARERVCCGVATAALLKHKLHATTVEDYATRAEGVRRFLGTVRASVTADVLPIDDAFGPTVTLPELEALTVSAETRLGADAINAERLRRGYAPLAVHAVSLVNGGNAVDKLSSTLIRAYIAGGELDGNMFE